MASRPPEGLMQPLRRPRSGGSGGPGGGGGGGGYRGERGGGGGAGGDRGRGGRSSNNNNHNNERIRAPMPRNDNNNNNHGSGGSNNNNRGSYNRHNDDMPPQQQHPPRWDSQQLPLPQQLGNGKGRGRGGDTNGRLRDRDSVGREREKDRDRDSVGGRERERDRDRDFYRNGDRGGGRMGPLAPRQMSQPPPLPQHQQQSQGSPRAQQQHEQQQQPPCLPKSSSHGEPLTKEPPNSGELIRSSSVNSSNHSSNQPSSSNNSGNFHGRNPPPLNDRGRNGGRDPRMMRGNAPPPFRNNPHNRTGSGGNNGYNHNLNNSSSISSSKQSNDSSHNNSHPFRNGSNSTDRRLLNSSYEPPHATHPQQQQQPPPHHSQHPQPHSNNSNNNNNDRDERQFHNSSRVDAALSPSSPHHPLPSAQSPAHHSPSVASPRSSSLNPSPEQVSPVKVEDREEGEEDEHEEGEIKHDNDDVDNDARSPSSIRSPSRNHDTPHIKIESTEGIPSHQATTEIHIKVELDQSQAIPELRVKAEAPEADSSHPIPETLIKVEPPETDPSQIKKKVISTDSVQQEEQCVPMELDTSLTDAAAASPQQQEPHLAVVKQESSEGQVAPAEKSIDNSNSQDNDIDKGDNKSTALSVVRIKEEPEDSTRAASCVHGDGDAGDNQQEDSLQRYTTHTNNSVGAGRWPTPAPTDAPSETARLVPQSQPQPVNTVGTVYGRCVTVETTGRFPEVGSVLGRYFCLGQLGKGTFSSIHKCINLAFFHHSKGGPDCDNNSGSSSSSDALKRRLPRVAAAKVELATFSNSGVLEAEATVLDFLHSNLPPGTVPVYMGHFRSGKYAAILMEFLPGSDMHQLRERVMQGSQSRRLTTPDAVYLTADVMLTLLQRMHAVGIVHRDVKPSNCVRSAGSSADAENGENPGNRNFCMVDFGLSKSVVVPKDSPAADKDHPFPGAVWLQQAAGGNTAPNSSPVPTNCKGHFRKERAKADFRGTSMYASLRVHQQADYCPRDDVWSLLYVFCDLVSGGLPWMSHAAARDRDACQALKERIHGDKDGKDETEQLLYGDAYHVTLFRRERQKAAGEPESRWLPLPEPLEMSKDPLKVDLLRKAFQHVAKLQFWETPDYELIRSCIRGFLDDPSNHPSARPVQWNDDKESVLFSPAKQRHVRSTEPKWEPMDCLDPLETELFAEAEETAAEQQKEKESAAAQARAAAAAAANGDETRLAAAAAAAASEEEVETAEEAAMKRLPVELRFRLAQMEYNTDRPDKVPLHIALRDWFRVIVPLLYQEWDAKLFEEGNHRTSTDGYRRDFYLQLLSKCQKCALRFQNFTSSRDCFYDRATDSLNGTVSVVNGVSTAPGEIKSEPNALAKLENKTAANNSSAGPARKKRKILSEPANGLSGSAPTAAVPASDMINLSRVLFGLRVAIEAEKNKKPAPPMRICFGS